VAAGLDYAAVGPEHAWLRELKRVRYAYATDGQARRAFSALCRLDGIVPALESAHAVAYVLEHPAAFRRRLVIINLSGRGDKDLGRPDA